MASEPASHVKPVPKQTFGKASPEAAREAAGEALPNGAQICQEFWEPAGPFIKAMDASLH